MDIADTKANIAILRQEEHLLAAAISEKHKELKNLEKTSKKVHEQLDAELRKVADEKNNLSAERKSLAVSKQLHEQYIDQAKARLKEEEVKIKSKVKELAKLNQWCQDAEDKTLAFQRKCDDLALEIERRTNLLSDVEVLTYAKTTLENEVSIIKKELSEITDSIRQTMYLSRQAVNQEKDLLAKTKYEREQEEIALYNLREQIKSQKHDIEIYISRAQIVYKQAFPELEMKL